MAAMTSTAVIRRAAMKPRGSLEHGYYMYAHLTK